VSQRHHHHHHIIIIIIIIIRPITIIIIIIIIIISSSSMSSQLTFSAAEAFSTDRAGKWLRRKPRFFGFKKKKNLTDSF